MNDSELLELILEQLNRTEHSEEHDAELPLSFTVLALSRELLGNEGKAAQREVQAVLDFLVSQGRVMARRGDRSGQLLYKLLIEGDTNHAPSLTPKHQPLSLVFGASELSDFHSGRSRYGLAPRRAATLGSAIRKEA